MTQYYVFEIKQLPNGEYEDYKHFVYDEDPDTARLKGESKLHEILSIAALSRTKKHSAILISDEGFPVESKCYKHAGVEPEPETSGEEPETEDEESGAGEGEGE